MIKQYRYVGKIKSKHGINLLKQNEVYSVTEVISYGSTLYDTINEIGELQSFKSRSFLTNFKEV